MPERYRGRAPPWARRCTAGSRSFSPPLAWGFRGAHQTGTAASVVPLSARGSTFGALVVIDSAGGDEGDGDEGDAEADRALLDELAQRAALAIDAARLYGERSHVARVLQASLRPPELPVVPGALLAARYRAAMDEAEIGGDFYDVHGGGNDWSIVVGDVCGKGVEAAVLTGQARQSVRTAALVDRDPAAVLALLNEALLQRDTGAGAFVTVVCGRLRPRARSFVSTSRTPDILSRSW
jgi:hypothetical protein